jgi:guanylate kinase
MAMPDSTLNQITKSTAARTIPGLAVVISAPSGSGKTSVLFEFLKSHPEAVFSVSATTRPPRKDERDGVNYHFITDEAFDSLLATGEFLEWNEVHGNRYGTPLKPVVETVSSGGTIILDTDTVGAFNIRSAYPGAVLVFLLPPSLEILIERLNHRNTETQERIKQRLAAYPDEIARMAEYDYIIVNDDLETAVAQFGAIIEAERLRSTRIYPTLTAWRNYQHGKTEHS